MEKIIKYTGKVWHVFTILGGIFMVASAAIIVLNIILRRFFNAPIYGSTEIVQYLGLAIASMAIVENEWGDGNIVMALIVDKLSTKAHYILNIVELAIETVVFAVIDVLLFKDALAKAAKAAVTSDLKMPKVIPSTLLAVGFVFLTLVFATKTILYIMAVKEGKEIDFHSIGRIK